MINKLSIAGVATAMAMFMLPVAAMAAVDITHLVVDGGANTTVNEGGSVDGKITFDITGSTDVESVSWELVGSDLPQQCENVTDRIADGTFTSTFNMDIEGASEGTWDVRIRTYGDDGANASNLCESSDESDDETFGDRITVEDDNDDNQNDNNNNSGSDEFASLRALIASLTAQISCMVTGGTWSGNSCTQTPVPAKPPFCASLVQYNGMNAYAAQASLLAVPSLAGPFHAIGVFAPTGFWGNASMTSASRAAAVCL